MKRKLGVASAVGVLVLALGLALTACGGDGDSGGVASLTDTSGQSTTNEDEGSNGADRAGKKDYKDAALEYARCMREHGVDMPDPVNGRFEFRSRRGDQRKMDEAQKACADILQDAQPPISEEEEAEMRDAALEFSKCMREHGVDMPDPQFPEGGGMLMRVPKGTERDPDFQEAQKACQPILDKAMTESGGVQGKES